MAGMLNEAGAQGAPPAQGAEPAAGAQEGGGGFDKTQAMLVLQPMRMLYDEKTARGIVQSAKQGNPAQVIAAAAISAVTASAKAGASQGAKFTEDQLGGAVIEIIKGLGALLVAGKVVSPDQVDQVVTEAVQLASQAQEQAAGGASPGGPPGPGGAPPGGPPGAGGPPPGPPGAGPGGPPMM